MTGSKRQTILTQSEIAEFHVPPALSAMQRQHFFELNPREVAFFRRQHHRLYREVIELERQRCQQLLATKLTSSTQQRLLQLIQFSETGSLLTALKTLP